MDQAGAPGIRLLRFSLPVPLAPHAEVPGCDGKPVALRRAPDRRLGPRSTCGGPRVKGPDGAARLAFHGRRKRHGRKTRGRKRERAAPGRFPRREASRKALSPGTRGQRAEKSFFGPAGPAGIWVGPNPWGGEPFRKLKQGRGANPETGPGAIGVKTEPGGSPTIDFKARRSFAPGLNPRVPFISGPEQNAEASIRGGAADRGEKGPSAEAPREKPAG